MPTPSHRIAFIFSLTLLGCGVAGSDIDDSDLGSAEFEVATVPTGVRCIHVEAKGSTTTKKNFSVTAASTVTLALGRVPLGEVVFEGTAYDAACPNNGTAAPSAQPSWVADPVAMEVFAGAHVSVPFVFRKYGNGSGTVDFVEPVADIAAGAERTVAAMLDGTVREWGRGKTPIPTAVAGLTDVVAIASGAGHACAIKSDRTLWCWGSNDGGQLGDGTSVSRDVPAQVSALTDVIEVSLGQHHSCAITGNKQLYCWGQNFQKQVGVPETTILYKTPVRIGENLWNGVVKVAAGGQHTCALTDQGRVYCWGYNSSGQLGNGTTGGNATVNAPVPALYAVVDVDTGHNNSCARRADGSVLCWGRTQPTPSLVSGIADAVQLTAGGEHACATLADGTARCWGRNNSGELGNGDGVSSELPVVVYSLNDAVKLSAGDWHTCAVAANGGATCWGGNLYGELGDGTTTARFVPTPVAL